MFFRMVKECMAILTNMTEAQSNILKDILNISESNCLEVDHMNKDVITLTNEQNFTDTNLSTSGVVNVDGIMLPIYNKNNVELSTLVPVKSTVSNLRSLSLAVASGKISFNIKTLV